MPADIASAIETFLTRYRSKRLRDTKRKVIHAYIQYCLREAKSGDIDDPRLAEVFCAHIGKTRTAAVVRQTIGTLRVFFCMFCPNKPNPFDPKRIKRPKTTQTKSCVKSDQPLTIDKIEAIVAWCLQARTAEGVRNALLVALLVGIGRGLSVEQVFSLTPDQIVITGAGQCYLCEGRLIPLTRQLDACLERYVLKIQTTKGFPLFPGILRNRRDWQMPLKAAHVARLYAALKRLGLSALKLQQASDLYARQ